MDNIYIYVENDMFESLEYASELNLQTDWQDENSEQAHIVTASFGAVDLKNHLIKILNANENIIQLTNTFPQKGKVFVVGKKAYEMLENKEDFACLNEDGVIVKSQKTQNLQTILLCGKSRRAYLYAISEYLMHLGVRWFSPGEKGMYIPNLTELDFENINIVSQPKFITRGCYSELITDENIEFLDWMMHNRLNFAFMEEFNVPHEVKKRGISICSGGHITLHRMLSPHMAYPYSHQYAPNTKKPDDIYELSPNASKVQSDSEEYTYFNAHPEWYAYINGKRSSDLGKGNYEGAGDNFCTSNKDAVNELCNNIIKSLVSGWLKNTDYLNFWMLDNGTWCECEQCTALGNYSYRLVLLVYEIDKRIKKAIAKGILKRNVKIMFPIYHETLPMPDKELPEDFDYSTCMAIYFPIERCYSHRIYDEKCTETNSILMNRLKSWASDEQRTYKGDIFLGEYYNVSAFASITTCHINTMKDEIPFYYEIGAKHMYYMHMTNKDWGTLTLLNYQMYSMLWNPYLDVDKLVLEYFELYYKNTCNLMKTFYEIIEKATTNMKYFKHYQYLFDGEDEQGKRLSLSAKLNNMAVTQEDLFPLKHMQYNTVLNDDNAGISLVDSIELFKKARTVLDEAIMQCEDDILSKRLAEEDMRFTYSENIVNYLYYMVRVSLQHGKGNEKLARNEFKKAEFYAKILLDTTFPTRDLLHFTHYKNGLKATWAEAAYYKYKQIYGF